jgi:hypothetical protein
MGLRSHLALAALCLGTQGCRRPPEAPPEPEAVVPVFPARGGPLDPRAQRACQALHELPARARAGCCGGSAGTTFTEPCARALSASLRSGAVLLEEAALVACERAASAALAGCQWVGATAPEPPAACRGLVLGTLERGRSCRSTLECRPGTFCRGVGPTDFGVCLPPQAAGSLCRTGVDVLAGYLRQAVERSHPECRGFCQRNRCFDSLPAGGACRVDEQCGPAGRCGGQSCVAGTVGSEAEPCVPGGCRDGLRCVAGTCAAPRPGGAACQTDAECLGACQAGRCTQRC